MEKGLTGAAAVKAAMKAEHAAMSRLRAMVESEVHPALGQALSQEVTSLPGLAPAVRAGEDPQAVADRLASEAVAAWLLDAVPATGRIRLGWKTTDAAKLRPAVEAMATKLGA